MSAVLIYLYLDAVRGNTLEFLLGNSWPGLYVCMPDEGVQTSTCIQLRICDLRQETDEKKPQRRRRASGRAMLVRAQMVVGLGNLDNYSYIIWKVGICCPNIHLATLVVPFSRHAFRVRPLRTEIWADIMMSGKRESCRESTSSPLWTSEESHVYLITILLLAG